ncbi:unnamed protein product, partial [Allacma fusca]
MYNNEGYLSDDEDGGGGGGGGGVGGVAGEMGPRRKTSAG